MDKIIELKDFRSCTVDWQNTSASGANLHKEIVNFIPAYAKINQNSSQQYSDELFPLTICRERESMGAVLTGYPICMLPCYTLGNVIAVTDDFTVYIRNSDYTVGQPTGALSNSYGVDMALYNGKVVVSHPKGNWYYGAIASSTSWSAGSSFGDNSTIDMPHYMETFGKNLYVADNNTTGSDQRLVKIVDTSWSVSSGLDLGTNWFIQGLKNVAGKYLAVFASENNYGGSDAGIMDTTLFLWDGIAADTYDQAIKFRGIYKASIVKDGNLYIFAAEGLDTICYVLDGLYVKKVGRIVNFQINTSTKNPKNRVAYYGNYFYLCGTMNSQNGIFAYNPFDSEQFLMFQQTDATTGIVVTKTGSSGTIMNYLAFYNEPVYKYIYRLNMVNTAYKTSAKYISNYIEIPEKRGIIKRIEVFYNTPPTAYANDDRIRFTVNYKDEYGDNSSMYNSWLSSYLNYTNMAKNRTFIEDIGVKCSHFSLTMNVGLLNTSTWEPIITKIRVHYEPNESY